MKPVPRTQRELRKEAVSLGLLQPGVKLNTPRKQLLSFIYDSYKINRGIGHATILAVGSSGVGKSSTVNHLFGLKDGEIQFAETSNTRSETRVTTEYLITKDEPKYEVKGLQLGVVDSPGFNDTDGMKQDACNFFSIKRFYEEHPTVGYCKPNIIFVMINAGDNRLDGANSTLVKSLKCLKRLQLVDTAHPNVVGVMTHAGNLGRKKDKWISNFEFKRELFKTILFKYLNVEADVIALENHADDEDLDVAGSYTYLPDGKTLQPKNLYDACEKLLRKNNDNFGLIAFNTAFSTKKGDISKGFKIEAKNARREVLNQDEQNFLDFFEETALGEGIEDPLFENADNFIKEKHLDKEDKSDIQNLTSRLKQIGVNCDKDMKNLTPDVIRFLTDMDTDSQVVKDFLKHLNVTAGKPKRLDDNVRVLSQGYNILNDNTVPADIFAYEVRNTKCGILVPGPAKFAKVISTETFIEVFESNADMVRARMNHLNLSFDVSYGMFSMGARAGFTSKASGSSSSSSKEYSFLLEQRMFEVSMANFLEMSFTQDFKESVKSLPDDFRVDSEENRQAFEKFFNKWGHFVVTKAYGGGSVELKVNSNSLSLQSQDSSEVQAEITAAFSAGLFSASGSASGGVSSEQNANYSRILGQSRMNWKGGDHGLHNKSTLEDPALLAKWRYSLMSNPTMLTTDLSLAPVSELVERIHVGKEKACYQALCNFLGGKFKLQKDKEEQARIRREQEQEAQRQKEEEESKKPSRDDDIKPPDPPKTKCFPGSSLVRVLKDGVMTDIEVKALRPGDLVETKSGYSKMLLFAHHAADQPFQCLKIKTADGQTIRLSGNHLIFVSSNKKTKMASEVKPGDKVVVRGQDELVEVVGVEEQEEIGFYCPITEDGTIYVDGILASCYASCTRFAGLDGHRLAHMGLLPIRLFNLKPRPDQEMHPYIKLLYKLPLPWKSLD